MTKSSKLIRLKYFKYLYFLIPPFILVMALILKEYIVLLSGYIPQCPFYELFHKYCPACGNTRSAIALMNGDILSSMRYNITIIFLCLLSAAFYIEGAFRIAGKKVYIVPRSNILLFILVSAFLAYFVIRNFITYLTP